MHTKPNYYHHPLTSSRVYNADGRDSGIMRLCKLTYSDQHPRCGRCGNNNRIGKVQTAPKYSSHKRSLHLGTQNAVNTTPFDKTEMVLQVSVWNSNFKCYQNESYGSSFETC
jgi:hypothetical protein